MSVYLGVYNEKEVMTHRGIAMEKTVETGTQQKNLLKFKDLKDKRLRPLLSQDTLKDADINVAQIRMVSTINKAPNGKNIFNNSFVGFILTGVTETHSEKVEIIPLPGDTFASYFFGAQPRQYSFQGILLNTEQDKWRDAFEELYNEYLRGTASARNFSIVQVSYDNRVVSGWLTSFSQQVNSNSDLYSSFNFTMLVSRSDIFGGSKKLYENYLAKLNGNLEQAAKLLNSDYSVLNKDNIDGVIKKVNTAFVSAPPAPKRGKGKRRRADGCGGVKRNTTASTNTQQANVTQSNALSDAAKCSTIETVDAANANIEELKRDLNTLTVKPVAGMTDKQLKKHQKDITDKNTELNSAIQEYNNFVKDSKVKESVGAEILVSLQAKEPEGITLRHNQNIKSHHNKDKTLIGYNLNNDAKGNTAAEVTIPQASVSKDLTDEVRNSQAAVEKLQEERRLATVAKDADKNKKNNSIYFQDNQEKS